MCYKLVSFDLLELFILLYLKQLVEVFRDRWLNWQQAVQPDTVQALFYIIDKSEECVFVPSFK